MAALLNSFFLVFVSEMGDKTQLLSLVLAARYKKPWTILLGVFIATLLNHGLATWLGVWAASLVAPLTMTWILSLTFFMFAAWILIPDKEEEFKHSGRFGVLLTTIFVFFMAEMGDKTQLATIALGARYNDIAMVTIGTTAGMLGSNALAIFLGHKLLQRVPMQWVRRFASLMFVIFGALILMHGLRQAGTL